MFLSSLLRQSKYYLYQQSSSAYTQFGKKHFHSPILTIRQPQFKDIFNNYLQTANNRSLHQQSMSKPYSTKWWGPTDVAIVTGGNKGLGFAICEKLVDAGVTTVLTARNEKLGVEAVEKLKAKSNSDLVQFQQLDISSKESIDSFAWWVKNKYGKFTILVNNAGVLVDGDKPSVKVANLSIGVNYTANKQITEALAPLIGSQGRIVFMGSRLGVVGRAYSSENREILLKGSEPQQLDKLAEDFLQGFVDGDVQQRGWPTSAYGVSKALIHSYTRIMGQKLKEKGVKVVTCCPGYVATDMTNDQGTLPVEVGADTPAYLALLPHEDIQTGKFYAERNIISYGG